MTFLYDFQGVRGFKAKLRPNEWVPIYLGYPGSQGAIATVIDVLAAFAEGGFLRFGWRALSRGPSVALLVLAVMLVPWVGVLALLPAATWFGHPAIQWGWVSFDLLVATGLVVLLRSRSPALATYLAVATTADALVTPVEATIWNLPRLHGWLEGFAVVFRMCGPRGGRIRAVGGTSAVLRC